MTPTGSDAVLVVDSEVSSFGRHLDHSALDCAAGVTARLLSRQPRLARQVDLIVAGAARLATSDGIGNGLAQAIGARAGLPRVPGVEVHAFCASANAAVHQAALAIRAGAAETVLVVGVEHLMASTTGALAPEGAPVAGAHGFSPPVFYALCADRYMHEHGAPVESLAQVAVNNRRHAASNPRARYGDPISVDEVLGGRTIASPLTLLQCCPPADGAGALIVAAADRVTAGEADGALTLLGVGSASADPHAGALTTFAEDGAAADRAYAMAGVGPEDIDVAEVHDAFTIAQVIHLEDVGLCPRGSGWRHALQPDAQPVVNPSGGLLSRGHPLGATGIAQYDAMRRYLLDRRNEGRYGFVQEAGGLRQLGQVLSECAVLAAPATRRARAATPREGGEAHA